MHPCLYDVAAPERSKRLVQILIDSNEDLRRDAMGVIYLIFGSVGFLLATVFFPNFRGLREGMPEYLLLGVSILLVGVGLLALRLDRLEKLLKGQGQKPA
jgi:hypothetical protein